MEEEELRAEQAASIPAKIEPEEIEATVAVDVTFNNTQYTGNIKLVMHADGICTVGMTGLKVQPGYDEYAMVDNGNCWLARVATMLKWHAMSQAGAPFADKVAQCEYTKYWVAKDRLCTLYDGRTVAYDLVRDFQGENYLYNEGERCTQMYDTGDCDTFWAPYSYWQELRFCSRCRSYVSDELWDADHDMCRKCWRGSHRVIESYGSSHEHNINPILFGDYKDRAHFAGMGFELEVDCDEDREDKNEDVAQNLISSCSLEDNEVRFAYDGSLNHGFEIISEPHTVKAFWEKALQWQTMLKYLIHNGYKSHDAGTCGLHIHVSRRMFGNTESAQEAAIAKVYMFFDDNWDDIVKISRRDDFEYCDKNEREIEYSDEHNFKMSEYGKWKKHAKNKSGCHYVALNNSNDNTFEYRLGRGTLNAWSFFSWIDFILTITKNAKRITVQKVESNDLMSWLVGIKESTAKYMYKRGAFRKEVLTLYPSIEWETDLNDRGY